MDNISIIGILVDKRMHSAPRLQEILTEYGDSILSRFGIHDPGEKQHGLITLNVRDNKERLENLVNDLEQLDGLTVRIMEM